MSQQTTSLSIAEMSCTACASTIAESFDDVGGDEGSIFDCDAEQATVRHDTDVSAEQFTSAVEATGYEARKGVNP